jgi:hypothetical protein
MAPRSYRTHGKFLTSLRFSIFDWPSMLEKPENLIDLAPNERGLGLFKTSAFGEVS